ncbi:MAG: GGDEF domain-containing protein [Candidatus Aenigmatarchaeota archaeon]
MEDTKLNMENIEEEVEKEVKRLVEELSAEEIAYILISRNEIVRNLGVKERAEIGLKYLAKKIEKSMAIYIKEGDAYKCIAAEGVPVLGCKKRKSEIKKEQGRMIELNNLGILFVYGEINTDEEKFTRVYAQNNLTFSLEHAIDYNKNFELAIKDYLTGVYNRGFLENELQREIRKHARERLKGLSFVMLDVDNFKKYNDTHGHQRGDEALKIVAKIMQDSVRDTDIVARYGGEEFGIVLPDTKVEEGYEIADKIRYLVERHKFYGQEDLPGGNLTISMGLANWPLHTIGDAKELIACADKALYKAKSSGKNRVEIYSI